MPSEPEGGVVVKTFATRDAALVVASQLEANGIATWTFADDCGGLYPNLSLAEGVHLLVSATDLVAACELLDLPTPPRPAGSALTPEKSSASLLTVGQILIGVVIGATIILSYKGVTNPTSRLRTTTSSSARQTHDEFTPDGKLSDRWIYAEGKIIEHFEDRNLDGEWDHWVHYENGRAVRMEEDNNFDGKPDETWFYKDGDADSMEKDTDFNGVPDEFCTYRSRLLQQVDYRPNGLKFTTTREFYSNGVLTEIWRGGDANGVFKERVKYDAFFNPVSTNLTIYPLLQVH
ncbi:MAG TPA: hypothetical protein VG938_11010 [Verrucomicrobiae bacterium]|jgi:hypothetical protein|nr:hypothetical protein [Verrucomicrobiae bacterium]